MIRIVRDGTKNIDLLRDRGRELGLVMSDRMTRSSETFMDSLTNAKGVMIGVRNVIGGSLLAAFTKIMDSFAAYVLKNRAAIKDWADEFASDLPERIENLGRDLRDLGRTARGFVEAVGGIKNVVIGLVGLSLAPLVAGVLGVVAAVTQLSAALLTANKRMGALNTSSAAMGAAGRGRGRGLGMLAGGGWSDWARMVRMKATARFARAARIGTSLIVRSKNPVPGWVGAWRKTRSAVCSAARRPGATLENKAGAASPGVCRRQSAVTACHRPRFSPTCCASDSPIALVARSISASTAKAVRTSGALKGAAVSPSMLTPGR